MNDCVNVEVRDALPDYLNHQLSDLDTATVRAHIESCAECRAELELLRSVKTSAAFHSTLDYERIARAMPAYGGAVLRGRVRAPAVASRSWLLAAAAAVVVVGGWLYTRSDITDSSTFVPTVAVSSEPKTTTSENTPPVNTPDAKATTPEPAKEIEIASLSLVSGTDDLSDADLEQLVSELDAIEAVPAEEPSSVTTTVDDIDQINDQ